MEEHAAGANNDFAFNDTARHLEVLSFTHNCFTPPLLRGEKLPPQLTSDPAAVYDASQWGCAQLRPANETRIFGTKRSSFVTSSSLFTSSKLDLLKSKRLDLILLLRCKQLEETLRAGPFFFFFFYEKYKISSFLFVSRQSADSFIRCNGGLLSVPLFVLAKAQTTNQAK